MVRLSILVPLLATVFCLFVVAQGVEEAKEQQTKEQRRLQAEAHVEKINKSQRKWKAKVHPRFAEMSDGEFKKMLGLKRDPAEHAKRLAARNLEEEGRPTRAERSAGLVPKKHALLDRVNLGKKKTTTTTTSTAAPELPPFDAREEWPECADVIGKVQDQSYCGSCWAVASASVMQDRICIRTGGKQKPEISAADVMSCAPGFGCDGGWPKRAFLYWAAHGVCTGSNYTNWQGCKPYPVPPDAKSMFNTPECSRHCTNRNYNKRYLTDLHYGHGVGMLAENDETDIMQVILFGGPVEADMVVYSDFVFYSSGVYAHGPDAYVLGGHAVRIIGWGYDEDADLPYWLVVNSWSTDWGENGYFKIERGLDESFIESWGINFGEPVVD